MTHYLYGAAVQGIQNFIFATNELKDIVGASELVESICTTAFDEFETPGGESVLRAAGNIKYIFDLREDCEKAVRFFPKKVMAMAPGITLSQAVVAYEDIEDFSVAVEQLEARIRAQRNIPTTPVTLGCMGMQRSRKTGAPVVEVRKDDYLDAATRAKRSNIAESGANATEKLCAKLYGERVCSGRVPYDIGKITDKNDWIAIIHADGNGLGRIVEKIGKSKDEFRNFSNNLEKATVESARKAFSKVCDDFKFRDDEIIPIRPVVLGGDDLTLICRGDLAMPFVRLFLEYFEKETADLLAGPLNAIDSEKLTACAGIAFVKSSFPFYFGYDLAESLCSEAKKDAKKETRLAKNRGMAPSCLMFHKVQDSFISDYSDIEARELTPNSRMSFKFGPYYLEEDKLENTGRWTIDKFTGFVNKFDTDEGNAVKTHFRNWLSLLHGNEGMAEQCLKRLKSRVSRNYREMVDLSTANESMTPVYDMLAYHSIYAQVTK